MAWHGGYGVNDESPIALRVLWNDFFKVSNSLKLGFGNEWGSNLYLTSFLVVGGCGLDPKN